MAILTQEPRLPWNLQPRTGRASAPATALFRVPLTPKFDLRLDLAFALVNSQLTSAARRLRAQPHVTRVTENVFVAEGYAQANCILIIGKGSNVIVDTTESVAAAKKIKVSSQSLSACVSAARSCCYTTY